MKKLSAFTFTHLTVDFACFTVLFASLAKSWEGAALAVLFLVYDLVAFGLQAPLGAILDVKDTDRAGFAAMGAFVTAAGLLTAWLGGTLAGVAVFGTVLAALGNAAFHVGAGSAVLTECRGKLTPSGIFNSAGALGVGLGTVLGAGRPGLAFPLALGVLLVGAVWTLAQRKAGLSRSYCRELSFLPRPGPLGGVVGILCLAIALHSLASGLTPGTPGLTGALALVLPLMICLGKLTGGILSDRLGPRRTLTASLALAAALLALSAAVPALVVPAVFFMNMSVPVTQCSVAGALPDSPGFAFGLTKLALVSGTAVTFFLPVSDALRPALSAPLTALAITAAWTMAKDKGGHSK